MSKQNVLIFKIPELFKILNELKNYLDFTIYSSLEEEDLFSFKKKNFKLFNFNRFKKPN